MPSDPSAGPAPGRLAQWVAPALVGLWLRCWRLGDQILGDDELHAVRAALSMPLGRILITWRETDHSLPLTALYRVWLDGGGTLSDGVLRTPVLLGSALLLLLAPRWLAPLVGGRLARLWAWLLALSPLLVAYGAIVRSYSVAVALSTCALLAFARFLHGDGRRFGVAYAGLGGLAIFFHLGTGPFVVAPIAVGLIAIALGREVAGVAPGPRDVLALAGGLLVAGGALLLPGAPSLLALIAAKQGMGGLDTTTALEVLRLHAGSASPVFAAAFWAAAAAGPVVLWRAGHRGVSLLVPGALVGQVLGLVVLSPQLDSPTLAARAFLVTLPMTLLAVAASLDGALVRIVARVRGARSGAGAGWPRGCALVALAGLALLAGPYRDPAWWHTDFRHHDDYVVFTRSRPRLPPASIPVFYRDLASRPAGAVLELPWHPFWGFGHSIPALQEQHRRRVLVSNAELLARDPRLALRSYVAARPPELLASDARYAVVHLDLESEERAARAARGRPDETRPQPAVWMALRREATRLRRLLDATWGPPDYEDGVVAVWDLERIRSS